MGYLLPEAVENSMQNFNLASNLSFALLKLK